MADLSDYQWLTGDAATGLLEDQALADEPVHRRLNYLRKTLSAGRATLIVQQSELRRRAVAKFGTLATRMFFTDIALQQATDLWTARYKASRVPGTTPLVDYCCGIGGDLLALAERGLATGWDRSAEIALLAEANLRVAGVASTGKVCVGDVESQTPERGEIWHVDPDRRVDGRRSTQLQWQSPGPEVVERWLAANGSGILKLAPATAVPTPWSEQAELEWISFNRECRHQVAWFGEFASGGSAIHRATAIGKDPDCESKFTSASFGGHPDLAASLASELPRFVFDTDPALRAARLGGALAQELGLSALSSGTSYLAGEHAVRHPMLACFEVLEQLPLRVATLSKALRARNIGRLEIKKRGVRVEPERLRKQLKLRGEVSATLLLTRLGTHEFALLARRVG